MVVHEDDNGALAALIHNLHLIRKKRAADKLEPPHHVTPESVWRTDMQFALAHLIEFLRTHPMTAGQGLDDVYSDLLDAIAQIQLGRSVHWLKPFPGGKAETLSVYLARGYCAGIIEILYRHADMTCVKAAKFVFDKLDENVRATIGANSPKAVQKWRDDINQLRSEHHRITYGYCIDRFAWINNQRPISPIGYAENVLALIPSVMRDA